MKTTLSLLLIAGMTVTATAQIPGIITYQGQVTSNGTNFTGTGEFRFLIYRTGTPLLTLWSHDNSSIAGEQPGSSIFIPVTNGLFTVGLGDTAVAGMTAAIPPDVFSNATLHLRIWFSDGANGLALLSPDQRITSAAYAMRAGNVPDEAITGAQIAPGSIRGVHIASNSITSVQIANTLTLGDLTLQTTGGARRIELYGSGDSGTLYMNHGSIGRFLEASGTPSGGFLRLFDKLGGTLSGQTTVELGTSSLGAGYARVVQENNNTGVMINGQNGGDPGGAILVYSEAALGFTVLGSSARGRGSLLTMYNGSGDKTVSLDADATGRASAMQLFQADGTAAIKLEASDSGGEGRITTQVLEITGGSDFSEHFDIQSPSAEPGMIVRIDPAHPGELCISTRAYDRTVAGVVSGAGGVKPGMLMRQTGTRADGKHPVALTGRVFCLVDASYGAVEPGDFITTSDTPGHGMKASNHGRALGAIIGKAMTPLEEGKGLVLVLVSLQ